MAVNTEKRVHVEQQCTHTSLGINSECTYLAKPVNKVIHVLHFLLPCLKSDFPNVWNFHIGFF